MNTLQYNGFIGSVEFSEKDGVFFGKIEGINALVTFEGESVKELTEAFREGVEDYLIYSQERGIEPHKTYSGQLNVRITPDMCMKIASLAKKTGVSINSFIKKGNTGCFNALIKDKGRKRLLDMRSLLQFSNNR